jgi:uncharacterized repeat protein (TIGR03803 family)
MQTSMQCIFTYTKTMKNTLLLLALSLGVYINSLAQVFSIRHDFSAPEALSPRAIIASNGKLYGTAWGDENSAGRCFSMDESGANLETLHSFCYSDGAFPEGALLQIGNTLYGTTTSGGASGKGTLFALTTDGNAFSVIRSFAMGITAGNYLTNEDGAFPQAPLIAMGTKLFGAAAYGGHWSGGTVFSMQTDGSDFLVIHHFTGGPDGAAPSGSLLLCNNRLYGTARDGGDDKAGIVFSLTPDGTDFSVLHNFAPGQYDSYFKFTNADGSLPNGSLILDDVYLYGTTSSGGAFGNGTVFRLKSDGSEFQVVRHFSPDLVSGTGVQINEDGSTPVGHVVPIGKRLYGVTYGGGSEGFGTIYTLRPDGSEFTVLHSFSPSRDGYCVNPDLTADGNTLFGSTRCGGASDRGTAYALTIAPRFLSIWPGGAGVGLTCDVVVGRQHAIQYTANSSCADWNILGMPFTPNNSNLQITDPVGHTAQRFYRIQMFP